MGDRDGQVLCLVVHDDGSWNFVEVDSPLPPTQLFERSRSGEFPRVIEYVHHRLYLRELDYEETVDVYTTLDDGWQNRVCAAFREAHGL